MFHFGIFAESSTNIIHIGIQFIFRNIKGGRVDVYPFEIYQVGRQLKQCIHIFKSHIYMRQCLFLHHTVFYDFLQRSFY